MKQGGAYGAEKNAFNCGRHIGCSFGRITVIYEAGDKAAADKTAVTIVIDPGHGGVDGGAQADDGTPEKNINLNIALKLKKLAENDGWNVIMTREEDTGLYSEQNSTIRSKKARI